MTDHPASGKVESDVPVAVPLPRGDVTASVTHRPRRGETPLVLAAMVAVLWFFRWTVAANGGFDDMLDMDYYRLLVRGWQKGHLYLDQAPSPGLLALTDPYDPTQNAPHRLGDASYFRGHYYLYFGAAPALTVMLPYALLTGRELTTGAATLVFCAVAFLTASLLWLQVRRYYFPGSARIVAPLGILMLGFGTHLLALAQRAMFWELSIAAGAAFTLLAVLATFRAMHGRRPLWAMAAAGACLGLAVASRPTCLFAAPLLLPPLWLAWRERHPARSAWRMALAAALPLVAWGVAMMVHNHERFGHPLEFGQHYQLSGAYEGKLVHFSPRFIAHNIAVYFFQPVQWTWEFPFAAARGIPFSAPGYFGTEEVSGILVTFGFMWSVIALPLAWRDRPLEEARRLAATLLVLAGYSVPVTLLLVSYFSTTTRYQADFAAPWGIAALIGLLAIERALARRRVGFIGVGLAMILAAATVVMGGLLSFDYHGRALSRNAPQLWAKFDHGAHAALAQAGVLLGQLDGPRVLKVRFQPRPIGTREFFWRPIDPRADESIVLEHMGDHLIRFGYVRGAAAPEWGRPLRWESNHTHTVAVQLPSLYRPAHGWMSGLRRHVEYRERTSAAVWFSGGRALGTVVSPWPAGLAPGGAVAPDFSGTVLTTTSRFFRDDEIEQAAVAAEAERGGILRLQILLPEPIVAEGEPLFAAGAHYGSDIVFVRDSAAGVKFVFEHYGQLQMESKPLHLARGPHVVEMILPSCRRGNDNFGASGRGEVIVRVDGEELIRTEQECTGFYPRGETIGRNPFGTTCAPEFRGWVLAAAWLADNGGDDVGRAPRPAN